MNKFEEIITSPAVISLISVFVFNLLTLVVPQLSGVASLIGNAILLTLTGYLHTNTVNKALTTGSIQ